MKKQIQFLVLLTIVCFSGCHKDPEPNPEPDKEQEYLQRLKATWTLQKAMVDAVDVTDAFGDLILIIEGKTFTVQNQVAPLWPASGSYTLSPDPSSDNFKLIRGDGMEMKVQQLSSTVLTIEMLYQYSGGRTTSVSGKHEFFFTK
ncbi:MAG TPA: hypothetical protein VIT44_17905 [Cyclobacteriaceae bacterium]